LEALSEPSHIVAERETLHQVLDVLKKATIALKKDPDLALTFQDTIASQKSKEIQKPVVHEESKALPNLVQASMKPKEEAHSLFPRPQPGQVVNRVPTGGNISNPFGHKQLPANKNTLFGDLDQGQGTAGFQSKFSGPQAGQGVHQAQTGGNMNNPFGQKKSTGNINNLFGHADQGKNTR